MKRIKLFTFYVLGIIILLNPACTAFPKFTDKTEKKLEQYQAEYREGLDKIGKKVDGVDTKLKTIEENLEKNKEKQKESASSFVYGTKVSLLSTPTPWATNIQTAFDMNERALLILGNPSIKEAEEMKKMVEKLNSDLEKERAQGKKLLEEKDKQIAKVQEDIKKLETAKNEEIKKKDGLINNYKSEAEKIANEAGGLKTKFKSYVSEFDSWFGLGAVWYGIKKFATSIFWILVGLTILYLILRILAASNPFAKALFGIFEFIGGSIINFVKWITPDSINLGGLIKREKYDIVNNTNKKIIDKIQELKEIQKKFPDKTYTLNDLLDGLDKLLDKPEKEHIEEKLKELSWK